MCGIVGIAGDINFESRKVFKDMLDVCQLRGRDATGVIRVKDNLDYTWVKREGPPAFLFDTKMYDKEIDTGLSSALIGHCRAKTNGPSGHEGAHPFDYPEQGIIGVHNGTLNGHHNLEGYSYNKVDSDVLYNHLAVHGPQETFSKTKGAWACVWWDNVNETLNFIRNDQRPLWFTYSEDKRQMFWASEPWMFGAVSRKIKLWEGADVKGTKKIFLELPINTLWSFKINRDAKGEEPVFILKKQLVIEPVKEEVRRYTGNYGVNYGSSSKTWRNGEWVENDKGVLVRNQGGSVPRPFDKQVELEDPLPPQLLPKPQDSTGKAGESTTTELSNVHYLNTSAKPTGSSQESKESTHSTKSADSSQDKSSKNSQASSKKSCSGVSRDLKESSSKDQFQYLNVWPMVSLRRIAGGLLYITDKLTGNEYSEAQFEDNTRATCSHCDEPIGGLEDVSFFVDKFNFVCRKCSGEKVKKVA